MKLAEFCAAALGILGEREAMPISGLKDAVEGKLKVKETRQSFFMECISALEKEGSVKREFREVCNCADCKKLEHGNFIRITDTGRSKRTDHARRLIS